MPGKPRGVYPKPPGSGIKKGQKQLKATTASWWCEKGRCGEKIYSVDQLRPTLEYMLQNICKYSPASFVKEFLSDEVCMKRILDALVN